MRGALLPCLVARIASIASHPETVAHDFLDATGLRGQEVRARTGETEEIGELVGISFEQGVTLRRDDGTVAHIALEFVREVREVGG